jgi:hypothetical protein
VAGPVFLYDLPSSREPEVRAPQAASPFFLHALPSLARGSTASARPCSPPSASARRASPGALVLASEGKFFSNGYDLAWARAGPAPAPGHRLFAIRAAFRGLVADLLALPVPTVTTVTGHAAGAGCALAHDAVPMRASRGFSLLARATTWPAGEPARWAPCCGGGNPGPAGPVGARAARRGVGVLPAGVSRHCLQRAWGLEAVRPLRGVQVSASPPSLSLSLPSLSGCASPLFSSNELISVCLSGTSFPSARWTSSTRRCSSSGTASASLAARTWSPRPASSSTSPETRYLYLHIHSTSALNSACWVFHVPFSCFPSHGICFNSRALDSAINLHHTFRLVSHCHTSLGVNQNHRFLARYTKARVT